MLTFASETNKKTNQKTHNIMNTTIIKADKETRTKVMEIVLRKLNKASRPVATFNGIDEDEMVISGCPTPCFASVLPARVAKKITWLHCC